MSVLGGSVLGTFPYNCNFRHKVLLVIFNLRSAAMALVRGCAKKKKIGVIGELM